MQKFKGSVALLFQNLQEQLVSQAEAPEESDEVDEPEVKKDQ